MRVAIHQPNFLPRLKVLQKIAASDYWIILDTVQYAQREWQNRTRLVNFQKGTEFWLTIPCMLPNGHKTKIADVIIQDIKSTNERINNSFIHTYRRSKFWKKIDQIRAKLTDEIKSNKLLDITILSTILLLNSVDINPSIIFASELNVICNNKSKYLAELCKAIGASSYIADSGALSYLDTSFFKEIDVLWQDWKEPIIPQITCHSWRDVSGINYLAHQGLSHFRSHLQTINYEKRD